MASIQKVKNYLGYWFQLGKPVHIDGGRLISRPAPVIEGNRFSRAFSQCWQEIMAQQGRNCYLEGTSETIEQLLSSQWEIIDCARCSMPMAVHVVMPVAQACPCDDLVTWPNDQLPAPRLPVSSKEHLENLKARLNR